ncbi:MAG: hypothetical protein HQL19_07545 [Candidatus Omnitrophica bacterium]|nr:hypothetical protein [Candidatus Omnitrophota bacterium]
MIVLLDAKKQATHFCLMDKEHIVEQGFEPELSRLKERLCQWHQEHDIEKVGYRVMNGGMSIDRTVMERTIALAAHIGEDPCLGFNSDSIMKELVEFCAKRFVSSRHFMICDSAFFLSMPRHSRLYAIPFEYSESGIIRYGRQGMVHEWAAKTLAGKGVMAAKTIHIVLNDSADVVALKDGKPVMISQGFSSVDGMMSKTGCGAIDTSIVFQLFADGVSAEDIEQILAEESGFKALTGSVQGFSSLVVKDDLKSCVAKEMFAYHLLKTIGAYAAILDGVDALVFIGNNAEGVRDWVCTFIEQLEFLGLKKKRITADDTVLTSGSSSIGAYYLNAGTWSLMSQALPASAI